MRRMMRFNTYSTDTNGVPVFKAVVYVNSHHIRTVQDDPVHEGYARVWVEDVTLLVQAKAEAVAEWMNLVRAL